MTEQRSRAFDIGTMPRGGPNASWLDRRMQTDVLEYIDRYDVSDEIKQVVISELDRQDWHESNARTALSLVADIDNPRILELGAGHGKLSAKILELHPTATVTVTDLDPTSVAKIAAGPLGTHPRAHTQVVDATAIDAAENSYDLVVFAMSFHHLPPALASRAIAEATRISAKFLVIDLARLPTPALPLIPLLGLLIAAPGALRQGPLTILPFLHDAIISMLRAYRPQALTALAQAADPAIQVEFLPAQPPLTCAVFSRT
ncbi:class I SAM-dependent methyltransferase [Nocardia colli]|uniref:Class I SAM-dependent methyltransferase n=1 Tax=Nocardia colli TaxID=2545717 RepID=A0A5N0EHJ2_9NOCA|nr:class I SAM-dependent methyltransferase [Nocardia colli]KAA8888453.1 class I SAM-dependent methyltransferase [Nocardia colli]